MGIKVTATAGPEPLGPDVYPATMTEFEEFQGKHGPCFKWWFLVHHGNDEVRVNWLTGQTLTRGAKLRKLAEAILGQIEDGTTIDLDDLLPGPCRVVLTIKKLDDGREFNEIVQVLPARIEKARRATEEDNNPDDIPQ